MGRVRHTYLGNYPSNKETDWTDALQGVAHDDQHWYFTQKTKVFKFHVTQKLTTSFKNAIAMARMPLELSVKGGNHFGDPDFVKFRGKGFLLIPLEGKGGTDIGKNPRLVIYSTDGGLSYIGETRLPKQKATLKTNRAGWFAVHPKTRVVYSSYNRIDPRKPVFRYRVNFNELLNRRVRPLKAERDLVVRLPNGKPATIRPYLQGGTFSPRGELYLINGQTFFSNRVQNKTPPSAGGIWVFDGRGIQIDKSITGNHRSNKFRYQYKPSAPHLEEPEGLTFWNLDALSRRFKMPSKKAAGQLHAILLNTQPGKDNYWFKHYRVSHR